MSGIQIFSFSSAHEMLNTGLFFSPKGGNTFLLLKGSNKA